MPVLPLFETPADPDAWHRVTSPGGYEWWYFDAEDAASDVQVVGIFLEGFVFHPGYLRRYARYRRRPTRHRPPVAAEYPCAYLAVYEHGRLSAQFMSQYPPAAFSASHERPEVRVGPNTLHRDDDGTLRVHLAGRPWRLTAAGPRVLAGQELSADLAFRPVQSTASAAPPPERTFLSRAMTGADHRWIVANPLCTATGTIHLGPVTSGPGDGASRAEEKDGVRRVIRLTGRGYHDHNYGTAPIGPGLRRWVWGRLLFEDRALTFHCAAPNDRSQPDEVQLLEADSSGTRTVHVRSLDIRWARRSATGLVYPQQVRFLLGAAELEAEWGELRLSDPELLDATPFYVRVRYHGTYGHGTDAGRAGAALCEIAYPHRLRWPILGRMVEMSIDSG